MAGKALDRVGITYGKWLVLKHAGYNGGGNAMWLCVCTCGAEREVLGDRLGSGQSVSCGCKGQQESREEPDWSVLEIEGVERLARTAARRIATEYTGVSEYDDLYQEALIHLATRPSMIRACLADPKLGLGVLHHRMVQGLVDFIRPEAKRRNATLSYEACWEGRE